MLTIGIDWNNTIQDQIGCLVLQSDGKLTRKDFSQWDDPSGCKKMNMPEKEFIAWCWKNEEIQEMSLPFPGAKEVLDSLSQAGIKIKIITSSFMPVSKIVAWFDRHQIPFDTIVKAKDKSQIPFDLLIDDNPTVLQQMVDLGLPVLKFTLPWNQSINCPSFSDWRKVNNGGERDDH
jgi:5'(3')-deoxyribonucleotidase